MHPNFFQLLQVILLRQEFVQLEGVVVEMLLLQDQLQTH